MEYTINGTLYPILRVRLNNGDQIVAQTNALLSMTKDVEMKTKMYGGITKGVRRMAGGDSVYMSFFTAHADDQHVSFADNVCGTLLPLKIDSDHAYLCDRAAYLCGELTVDLDVAFMKKIRMGIFGGESFVMERLSGNGDVFLHGWGELQKTTLGVEEELKVSTSRLMAVSNTVKMDVVFIKSMNNILFSGQGLFITKVTGPGEVYVQSFSAPSRFDKLRGM